MTREERERKRFWFRVRVIAEFIVILTVLIVGYKWFNREKPEGDGVVPSTSNEKEAETQPVVSEPVSPFQDASSYRATFEERYRVYQEKNPEQTPSEVVLRVNMNLDYDFYDEAILSEAPHLGTLMVLCNKYYKMPESYVAKDLVTVPERYHAADGKEYKLDERALKDYMVMAEDAKSQGVDLLVVSAYRTYDFQKRLYNTYAEKNGVKDADTYSARPGHSEHETGLAVDLNRVDLDFENTEAFKWLDENAHEYGFILRYPKDQTQITGYMYEPWHYRYVGKEVAKQIKEEGITFEAYHVMYLKP